MREIDASKALELQLAVTGAHLSRAFGSTINEIVEDGFKVHRKIEMQMDSDSSVGVAKSLGLGVIGFSEALEELKPDLVLLLGDRYEVFSAAAAAMVSRIPIAHIHGGEQTNGLIDDAIRHSITKMSHVHFVAAESYRKRLLRMGESADRVHNVGGLGVESVRRVERLSRAGLESSLGISIRRPSLLVTYHPLTLDPEASMRELRELLFALDKVGGLQLFFTMPNSDPDNRMISETIKSFCLSHTDAHLFSSLGQTRYLSLMAQVDGVVGNSSSGLLEAPALNTRSLNVGSRQAGRLRASTVIDSKGDRDSLIAGLKKLLSVDQIEVSVADNPYGLGFASEKIVSILESQDFSKLLIKGFNDKADS
jgi:GDP/UDP-N,N'-diacetylbacillosamine 2-epimerase (hydrolysing)